MIFVELLDAGKAAQELLVLEALWLHAYHVADFPSMS
jgi:hypothetical protein